jgi:hypothetical protein
MVGMVGREREGGRGKVPWQSQRLVPRAVVQSKSFRGFGLLLRLSGSRRPWFRYLNWGVCLETIS